MLSNNHGVEAFFLKGGDGNIFAVFFAPTITTRASFLYIPPFGEEANRCRTIAAQQARAFAENGYACLLIDPCGTGDSAGELEDASWDSWKKDILAASEWLDKRTEGSEVILWGMRLGALLAADLVNQYPGRFKQLVFWQPVLDGKTYLTQFLRQRVVSLSERNEPPETTKEMMEKFEQGGSVEVAGYTVPGLLATAIKNTAFKNFNSLGGVTIFWLEVEVSEGSELSIASQRAIDHITQNGGDVTALVVKSPPVWTLQKRTDAPKLIDSTITLISNRQQ